MSPKNDVPLKGSGQPTRRARPPLRLRSVFGAWRRQRLRSAEGAGGEGWGASRAERYSCFARPVSPFANYKMSPFANTAVSFCSHRDSIFFWGTKCRKVRSPKSEVRRKSETRDPNGEATPANLDERSANFSDFREEVIPGGAQLEDSHTRWQSHRAFHP